MVTLFIGNRAGAAAVNATISGWPWAFNSELFLAKTAGQNHELRIHLAVCLQMFNKKVGEPAINSKVSSSGHRILLQDWTTEEWDNYQKDSTQAANVWNNKFWLIPPDSYNELRWPYPPREPTHKPNFKCSLEVDFNAKLEDAHKVMFVFRLHDSYKVSPLRAHAGGEGYAGFLDSTDAKPSVMPDVPDNVGVKHQYSQVPVAHEIGHLLGQDHIGVLKHTELCRVAAEASNAGPNTLRCYGAFDNPRIADNIMGMGMAFDVVNAQPWRDRIAQHTETDAAAWKVSQSDVPPAAVKWDDRAQTYRRL